MNVLQLLVNYLNGAYSEEWAPERKTKMKHTPGPWILNGKSPSGSAVICRGPEVGWNIALALPTAIPGNDTMEANARLIASAPDLLEMLKKAQARLFMSQGNDELYLEMGKLISKAEGHE